MVSIIVATDKTGVIGRENKIPWRLKDDLVMLKKLTQGHTVILGRKTYESMQGYYAKSGRPLPGKTYIVVSRNRSYDPQSTAVLVAHSVGDALAKAHSLGDEAVFAIGGVGIFTDVLPFTDRIYLTEVQATVPGDVSFPEFNRDEWRETSREHHAKDARNEYDFEVVVLQRQHEKHEA